MGRSRSTPGLVESKGKVPVNDNHRKEQTSLSTATLLTEEEQIEKQSGGENNADGTSVTSGESTIIKLNKAGGDSKKGAAQAQGPTSVSVPYPVMYPPHLLGPNIAMINFENRNQQLTTGPPGVYPQQAAISFYPTSAHSAQFSPFCNLSPAASTNHLSIPSNSAMMGTPSPTSFMAEDVSASATTIAMPTPVGTASQPTKADYQSQDALLSEIKRLRERLLSLETENASMSMKLNQQQWQVENR